MSHNVSWVCFIVRLFKKVLDFKKGAEIDAETMNLIEEVFDTVVKDDSIIDLRPSQLYRHIQEHHRGDIQKSIHESNNPILRHIYKNMLDIEQLLAGYFYGFYTGQNSYIRDYLYISWILWAYLVSEEQRKAQEDVAVEIKDNHTIYDQLTEKTAKSSRSTIHRMLPKLLRLLSISMAHSKSM